MLNTTPPAPAAGNLERASFTGTASEYFGIWIVNVLLTIITLGIYSAWAKVRRNRYFYGNTVILGRSFEYHAKGLQIFLGRLIVIGFFILVNILSIIHPLFSVVTTVLILVALPWLLKRGLRFSARVTSYRNVRFDFVGSAWGAFVSILLGSFVAFITFGILAPLASRWLWRYIFNNMRYGDRPFVTEPRLKSLYGVWWLPALMVVIGAALLGILAAGTIAAMSAMSEDEAAAALAFSPVHFVFILVFVVYGAAALIYRIGVRNVVWSAASLDGRHQLFSDVPRWTYVWVAVTNVIVTIITLGLMRPWAAVRMARFTTEHTGIAVVGDLGEILSSIEATGAAISAEYMDMEGFDFGF
ncbi:YjgN family protein [Rhizobium terrae]|uniref:YjgN family protein n=1 Tax=Rhizobium terrae TaxID=2171756 RepID=UPI000E3DBF73|nr:YjgN family protein [Rhizobium terrae]